MFWMTQPSPCGFGDAVKYSKPFVENDDFILQAGDVAVLKKNRNVIDQIIEHSRSGKLRWDTVRTKCARSQKTRHCRVGMSRLRAKPDQKCGRKARRTQIRFGNNAHILFQQLNIRCLGQSSFRQEQRAAGNRCRSASNRARQKNSCGSGQTMKCFGIQARLHPIGMH